MSKVSTRKNLLWVATLSTLAIANCSLCATAQAAPVISAISGNVNNDNTVTISGSGFGANGPNIVIFDDFEKGVNGSVISTSLNSASVNQWSRDGGNPELTIYSNAQAHSGAKSMQSSYDTSISEPGNRMILDFSNTTEVFYSYWTMVPMDKNVPGDNATGRNPIGPNWKQAWLAGPGSWPDSDYISVVVLANSFTGNDIGGMGYDDMTTYNGRSRYPDDTHSGESWWWSTNDWIKGQWKRFDGYHKGGQTTGIVILTELTSSGPVNRISGSNTFTLLNGHYWSRMSIPGYGRGNTTNGMVAYDDVYLATGPGARARVEIGNASMYNRSNNLAIATATSWSDTSVQATIRQGSFQSGTQAYLYVIDMNGNANAQGYPITIGQSSGSMAAPQGLCVVSPQTGLCE